MKPHEGYTAMIRRLERSGLEQTASKADAGREGVDKTTGGLRNTVPVIGLVTERPTSNAQRIADIKLQFASGDYHIDTGRLAAKLLETGFLFANAKPCSQSS